MKKMILALVVAAGFSIPSHAAENWKEQTTVSPVELGMMTGLSLYGSEPAWGFLANGAYLVNASGWIDGVDDRIWAEVQAGPSFFSAPNGLSQASLQYSTHLRWDFTYNGFWTAYALGGASGFVTPEYLGNKFTIHPRFAIGVEYQTKTPLMFRGELSAEFMGAGIALNF